MSTPNISIIIPSYNNLPKLEECIASIKTQTYTNYEVWVIDGNSTDGTQEFLKTLSKPFYWVSEKDSGIYDAMNKGIEKSKGEWLYFLGTDDGFYTKEVLEQIFSSKIKRSTKLIFGNIIYTDSVNSPFILSKKQRVKKPKWSWKIWIWNTVHHQGTIYKKDIFLDNKYNLEFKYLSDYEFNMYLYKKGVPYQILDKFIAKCSPTGVSKSGGWNIYKEEIVLKSKYSSPIFYPIFFVVSFVKYLIRKNINA